MVELLRDTFGREVATLDATSPQYVVNLVDRMLTGAREAHASDVHLLPTADGLESWWRIDGVLQQAGLIAPALAPNVLTRLKVLSNLMTYRTDIPQEGRVRGEPGDVEMRVSTFPTLFGEKAVVRIFAGAGHYETLDDLGLPDEILRSLTHLLAETSGAILLAGPAGSGKTTTIYACLRAIIAASGGGRSVITLEDPIEVVVPGAAQSQVNHAAGFDLATGLRSLMRQDPEVIAVGEIRDRPTAEVAFEASLTGHLIVSTFHAGSAAGVISRLSEMGIEPYVLRSGIRAIICQRLVRRLCVSCARETDESRHLLGLPVDRAMVAVGCPACRGTGYRGRLVLAEFLVPDDFEVSWAILSRTDLDQLETSAIKAGMVSRWERARRAVEEGLTDPSEVRRVLGFSDHWEKSSS
jgi:type II secretory ATPase GspE/PulE/Tfp pilus assembly ATPase PilB-like protein